MTWIEALLQFLRQFVPWVVVRDGQQGVRFSLGRAKGPLPPNWYWSIPLFWYVETVQVAETTTNLLSLSFTTKDGHPVVCSANLNHRITNAVQWLTQVQEGGGSMAQEIMKYLHRAGRRVTWDELVAHQRSLERRAMRSLQRKVEAWGVEVVDVGLTDLVRARQYRLFGDPSTGR